MVRRCVAVVAIVIVCSQGTRVFAAEQAATATLAGAVVDESAALVPSARIPPINLDTGLQRSVQAGMQGGFVLSLVPPGRYRLTAQHDGFATTEISDVVLSVGDAVDLRVMLKVAAVDATIAVTADASVTTSPAVSTVV